MRRGYQTEYRGKYVNGKIELLQKTDLEEGEEVFIYPDLIRYRKSNSRPLSPASDTEEKGYTSFLEMPSSWRDDPEYWDEFMRTIYKDGRRRNYGEND